MDRPPLFVAAHSLGIPETALEPYGWDKAKLGYEFLAGLGGKPRGRLVLVTAINPTPAGEGKTTATIGLGDGLRRLGQKVAICLREPSLGPCFGRKGGATGGGKAQVTPRADINLHFTGDFHAVTSAHNLLAAMVDNALHFKKLPHLAPSAVVWRRVLDMNDRSLRHTITGLGGPAHGEPRETGFDITTASEIMAILCLADGLPDLQTRLARVVVGWSKAGVPVTAAEVKADGAMAALLVNALKPNLVRTLEGTPAFVHGGPFANIAHGCSSVMATKAALALADIVVTEAGFGADLGAEKFFDIKCRLAGLAPAASVLVATVRALKLNGGARLNGLEAEDLVSLRAGLPNLLRHAENLRLFGVPVVVAINRFATDTEAELKMVEEACAAAGVKAVRAEHFARGGEGAEDLAQAVLDVIAKGSARFAPLYDENLPVLEKIDVVARRIYRAAGIDVSPMAAKHAAMIQAAGFGRYPVCIAKTQYSFSADPLLLGAPEGHIPLVRDVTLSAGAGFVVALLGEVQTMPGLPREPVAERMSVDGAGDIVGMVG